jgi:periplasmic divalent cation tolerance protein
MILVYVTCKNKKEAEKIGRHLLKRRLVACAKMAGKVESRFWWKGKIDRADEVLLILVSTEDKFNNIEKETLELHSYEVPEIFSIKVDKVNKPYLDWLIGEAK